MWQRRRIGMAAGLGLALLALSLWGTFRGGTAAELLPEETPAPAVETEAAPLSPETGGIVMKYDAARYVRTEPLRDPFHLEVLTAEETPAAVPRTGASGRKEQAAQPEAERPVLKGVLILGDDRRAMMAYGGQTLTVKTGEQVGQWTVSDIEERQVVLSGAAGQAVLTL